MPEKKKPTTIAEYIAAAPPAARKNLEDLHACLSAAAPEAEQAIKWGAPAFTRKRILFTFAAYRNHINFYPTPSVVKAFKDRLDGIETTASGISFPHEKPLPLPLIAEIAAYRLRDCLENDARWM